MAFPDDELTVIISAYIGADPTADPGTWPSPTDWSGRLLKRDIDITTGRRSRQKTAAAGSCTLWLSDDDLALSTGDLLGTPVAVDVDNVGSSPPYGRYRGFIVDMASEVIPGDTETVTAVRVTLAGLLRQRTQGAVVASSLARWYDPTICDRMGRSAPAFVWSLESDPLVGGFLPAVGGQALSVAGDAGYVTATDGPPGSAGGVRFECYAPDAGGAPDLAGRFDAVSLSGLSSSRVSMAVCFRGEFADTPTTTSWRLPGLVLSGGTRSLLVVTLYHDTNSNVPGSNFGIDVTLDGSQQLVNNFQTAPSPFDGLWHALLIEVEQDGADIVGSAWLDGVAFANTLTGGAGETLGTPSGLTPAAPWNISFATDAYNNVGSALSICHIAVWSNVTPPDPYVPMTGHHGETDIDRIDRILDEEGIPHTPSSAEGIRLGPQPIADPMAVVRDAEAAGHGVLYELVDDWGLGYMPLRDRYNQTAAMTINLSAYNVKPAARESLTRVRNDQGLRNELTISRPAGATVTVRDEASISKRGRYNDSAQVNLAEDSQLEPEGYWRLHEANYTGARWGTVSVDLGNNPSTLLPGWLNVVPGNRVDRTGHPLSYGEQLDVQGYAETLSRHGWTAKPVTEPYSPLDVGEYEADAADAGDEPVSRYDTAGCETLAGAWLAGSSFDITTPDHASLDVTGDLDIRVDATAASWVSGSTQTLVAKYGVGTQRSYFFRINGDGTLALLFSTDGSADTTRTSTVGVPKTTGRLAVRVTLDVNNGAAGHTVTFYTATADVGLSDLTWVQLGDAVINAGTVSIHSGSEPLQVGVRSTGVQPFAGVVHAAQVRSGIAGTIVAYPRLDTQAAGTTSFADSAGRPWTLTGAPIYHDFVSGTDTALLVGTTSGPSWTSAAGDLPMNLACAGAVLQVTAVTGAGAPQLLTVTQATVNGVAKTIEPGEAISLARPVVYAL